MISVQTIIYRTGMKTPVHTFTIDCKVGDNDNDLIKFKRRLVVSEGIEEVVTKIGIHGYDVLLGYSQASQTGLTGFKQVLNNDQLGIAMDRVLEKSTNILTGTL